MLLSEARTIPNFKKTRKNYNNIFSHHQLRMACLLFHPFQLRGEMKYSIYGYNYDTDQF